MKNCILAWTYYINRRSAICGGAEEEDLKMLSKVLFDSSASEMSQRHE